MNLPHEVAGIIIRCLDLSEYTPETFPRDAGAYDTVGDRLSAFADPFS